MYIITGGAGFIGSALLREMNKRGISDILIIDNLAKSEKWLNLRNSSYADYIHRDKFIEIAPRMLASENIEGIAHLGACSSTTEKNADFLFENNFHYSRDLCQFALEHNIHFIHASSAATYGDGSLGFDDTPEILDRLRPLNMYGYSKHLFDLWLKKRGFPKNCLSLKFFNVFGPNEYHKGNMQSVIPKLFREINENGQATLFASARNDIENGDQKRDFVYVKDCARLLATLLLDRRDISGIRNIGSGNATSFRKLASAIFSALGKPENIVYTPTPKDIAKAYQYYTCANMAWLEKTGLNFKFTPFQAAVHDYVCNYLAGNDPYL